MRTNVHLKNERTPCCSRSANPDTVVSQVKRARRARKGLAMIQTQTRSHSSAFTLQRTASLVLPECSPGHAHQCSRRNCCQVIYMSHCSVALSSFLEKAGRQRRCNQLVVCIALLSKS